MDLVFSSFSPPPFSLDSMLPTSSSEALLRPLILPPLSAPTPSIDPQRLLNIHSVLNHPGLDKSAQTLRRSRSPLSPTHLLPGSATKLFKDTTMFEMDRAREPVNYPPTECSIKPPALSEHDWKEIVEQHERFSVDPSEKAGNGKIADHARYIPYLSEKKEFFEKTGREGFEAFEYTFKVPDDATGKVYTVLWDYQIGLVRVTPFFKALNHVKTIPGKAINNNKGLKELSHSITGGALIAQGYWIPYSCARALCSTFCYHIRWALTPIFGYNFVQDCLRPDEAGFGKFIVAAEIIRQARLDADSLCSGSAALANIPFKQAVPQGKTKEIPRSIPLTPVKNTMSTMELRPRPIFKPGSPFDLNLDSNSTTESVVQSPHLSPKSTPYSPASSWTSVNQTPENTSSLARTDMLPSALSGALPIEAHDLATSPSCRPIMTFKATNCNNSKKQPDTPASGGTGRKRKAHNRSTSPHSSNDDKDDHTPPSVRGRGGKRLRRDQSGSLSTMEMATSQTTKVSEENKVEDPVFRAAWELLNLHHKDALMAGRARRMRRMFYSKTA